MDTIYVNSNVRCYGGTNHGKWVSIRPDCNFLRVRRNPLQSPNPFLVSNDVRPEDIMFSIDTYRLDTYHYRANGAFKRMRVMILEGRDLFKEEEWQLEDDIHLEPWQPKHPPSILNEFDDWFDWAAYKYTRDETHIRRFIRV